MRAPFRWRARRRQMAPFEPAGPAPEMYELEAQWGPKTPRTTGAGDEVAAQRLRSPARPCCAVDPEHRPHVPQRVRGATAAHRRRRVVPARPSRPALCLDCRGGAQHRCVRGRYRTLCRRAGRADGELHQAPTQDDVAQQVLQQFDADEGVPYVGWAQKTARVVRTQRRRSATTGTPLLRLAGLVA